MGKVYCEVCKKRCRGNVLRVLEKFFHKDCFRCTECRCRLESGGFFLRNDEYFCQKDYEKFIMSKCKVCSENLTGEIVSALSFSFHKNCFMCTRCKSSFQPGDKVTVWKDQFFCINCSRSLMTTGVTAAGGPAEAKISAQRHRLSFADQVTKSPSMVNEETEEATRAPSSATSAIVSPRFSSTDFTDQHSLVGVTSPPLKTNGVTGKTTILKSSLRHSTTATPYGIHKSGDYGADYEIDNRLHKNPAQNGSATLPVESSNDAKHCVSQNLTPRSRTFSPEHSKSMHVPGRHHLSDYGRFYNHSYMNLNDQPVHRSTDQYRRSGLNTLSTAGSVPRLHHFHVPEGNLRYSLPPNRINRDGRLFQSSLRDALIRLDEPVIRKLNTTRSTRSTDTRSIRQAPHHSTINSSMRHHEGEPTMCSSPQLAETPSVGQFSCRQATATSADTRRNGFQEDESAATYRSDREASLEARRLAVFPSGQPRDTSTPSAIERYDWPAPASSAVVLAELMRERRQKRREQARLSGSRDDADSQEDLSIDASIDSHSETAPSSGIGKAILLDAEGKRRSYAHHLLDPVSASRTPNASSEPPFKTRYATHSFACNGTVRPGYTAGQLTVPSMTSSLTGSSFQSTIGRLNGTINEEYTFRHAGEEAYVDSKNSTGREKGYGLTHSRYSPARSNGTSGCLNGAGDANVGDLNHLVGSTLSYPSVLFASTPSAVFKTSLPPPPIKEVPYKDLVMSAGGPVPRGLDRTKLETYLSDAEFKDVFHLSRLTFYRLPEWKRNDLKQRVQLF